MPRWHDEHGANAVEFALILPVLIVLLFGTMYGASVYNTQQTITQAARDGARYGATLPFEDVGGSPEDPPPGDWFSAVEARALEVANADRPLTPGSPTVCVLFFDDDDNRYASGPECDGESSSGGPESARVEVIVTRPARIELGITSTNMITVRGDVTARYEPNTEADP